MPARVVGFGQIGVDVLHGRLELIDGIPELGQTGSGHEHVVGAQAVGRRETPGFEGPLAMAAPTVRPRPSGSLRGPESSTAPKASTNGG